MLEFVKNEEIGEAHLKVLIILLIINRQEKYLQLMNGIMMKHQFSFIAVLQLVNQKLFVYQTIISTLSVI
jgi:hypothetical protein